MYGGTGKGGDGNAFMRAFHDLSFAEACQRIITRFSRLRTPQNASVSPQRGPGSTSRRPRRWDEQLGESPIE